VLICGYRFCFLFGLIICTKMNRNCTNQVVLVTKMLKTTKLLLISLYICDDLCSFVDDQYAIRNTLYEIRSTKDYVRNYKQNMQNKPNFQKSQMNVNNLLAMNYAKMDTWSGGKNKANSKPIQSQYKPNTEPIQTQTKPILQSFRTNPSRKSVA